MIFDAGFYQSVLPDRVAAACHASPDRVPVVKLHLGDGAVLDVCHILALSERWLSVANFRDVNVCDDMDVTFIPYQLVTRVTVSMHHPNARALGFKSNGASAVVVEPPGPDRAKME